MATPSRFNILGPADATPTASTQSFSLFAALPTEIRIKIWLSALQRQRIIKVRLRNRMLMDAFLTDQNTPRPKSYENEDYSAIVDGYQTISKLFCVNNESREAAKSFYRVHLPCWLIRGRTAGNILEPGTLYFNPEYDFLHISIDTGQVVDFLHHLKTVHDPHRIGLLNLAIDLGGLIGGEGLVNIKPSTLSPEFKTSFTETLAQLREIFFVQIQRVGPYALGYWIAKPPSENKRNPSFPITAQALNFDRLPADPRPISQDLGKVFLSSQPCFMVHAWKRLLSAYLGTSDDPPPPTKLRVLLTYAGNRPRIYNYDDAQECIRRNEDLWMREISDSGHPEQAPDATSLAMARAVGFWLFPVEAFDGPSEPPNDEPANVTPKYIDLTKHWPELGLLSLH